MVANQFRLLAIRRFLPLFATQFLGAMNDNLFKQSLVVLIIFRLAQQVGLSGPILVTIAAGIFILPFFLFSATAGQLADKYEKARSIRIIKFVEIVIMAVAVAGFLLEDPIFLLAVLFLMGTQSAFFGPLKYGILPTHLRADELIGGNALVEGATFLAILIGTIAGGLVILTENGTAVVSVAIVGFAFLGWLTSLYIPVAPAPAPELKVNLNIAAEIWRNMRHASERRAVFLSILGISWFWLVGATFLTQFPGFTKDVLGADETVVSLFMAVFSIGIAIGSLLCNKILAGEISAKYVPLGGLGLTVFTLDLFFATYGAAPEGGALINAGVFMSQAANWRILADLALISVSGGIFTVPLYALLQHESEASHRARMIAANNIMNALFMVTGSIIVALMLAGGLSIPEVFLTLAIANAAVAAYFIRLMPAAAVAAVRARFKRFF